MFRFQRDCALTAVMYKRRKHAAMPWDDNEHSIRGLDDCTKSSKNIVRRKHLQEVLEAQKQLHMEGRYYDTTFLSEVAIKSSQEATMVAVALAKEDAAAVRSSAPSLLTKVRSLRNLFAK